MVRVRVVQQPMARAHTSKLFEAEGSWKQARPCRLQGKPSTGRTRAEASDAGLMVWGSFGWSGFGI